MLRDSAKGHIARRPRLAAAIAAAVAFAAVTAAVAGAGPAPGGAADVVQRTPSGLAVHSSLLAGHGDPPHTLGTTRGGIGPRGRRRRRGRDPVGPGLVGGGVRRERLHLR